MCSDSQQPWCCLCPAASECFRGLSGATTEPLSPQEAWQQLLPIADLPDALLFWALHRHLSALSDAEPARRIRMLQKLTMLLYRQRPGRPDLPFQVVMREVTGSLLTSAPTEWLRPGQVYSRPESYLPQLQVTWVQGCYEAMWLACLRGQLDGRYFPLSDHHIRGLSVIGEGGAVFVVVSAAVQLNPAGFELGSVSNLLFLALGSEQLSQGFVSALVSHFQQLSAQAFASLPLPAPLDASTSKPLKVQERPLLVVVSADLRQHPVGRFWLPIARQLRSKFRVISVAAHPRDQDSIRDELRQLSDEWWPLETDAVVSVAGRIRSESHRC